MRRQIESNGKIYVAGHRGVIGSALVRALRAKGYENIVTRSRAELDLTEQAPTREFFQAEKPDFVFLAAAKVGGVAANNADRVDFIYQNLMIQCNVVRAAFDAGVRAMIFLASTNIYPRLAPLPLKEGSLLSGALASDNEPDAIAKIAGVKLCAAFNRQYGTNYISAVPAKVYGPGDSFDPYKSHLLSALIRRLHDAKTGNSREAVVWGSGNPSREFIYSDDLADACVFLMQRGDVNRIGELINIGSGTQITIKELAQTVARVVGYEGRIVFDNDKDDAVPKKHLDSTRIEALGWISKIGLYEGINLTYADFQSRIEEIKSGSSS
jgi:GDP-L-fucose synthase